MFRYALKRGIMAIFVAFTVSLATFFLLHNATDPAEAIAGEDAEQEVIDQIREEFGFNRPLFVQYGDWIGGVLRGDFGESYFWRQPVHKLIISHAPVTLTLASFAMLVTIVTAIPLGIIAALNPNTIIDRIAVSIAVAAQAVPNFWLGLICIILFSVILQIFPVSGDDSAIHFVLPSLVLGLSSVPPVMRLTRTGLLDVLGSDFIRTARANGFIKSKLLIRHAMRNAMLPVVGVLAVQLGGKLNGSIITESVFALNGVGRLALESILGADIPTLQTLVFLFAVIFVGLTFLADVLNAWLDPRIRLG
ncbi:MAG: ABC transporter permease [Alphaproteobacteria bacterium]|nr:ABC transporter permease [Alphaproteobacteria bacterium]